MGSWENGCWKWRFDWQRPLLDRERLKTEELLQLIGSFSPKVGVCDSWCWVKDATGIYSVKSAYGALIGISGLEERRVFKRIWRTKAPSSQLVLSWKVIINRVQTRTDLARRHALPANASLACGLCDSDEECSQHLFFNCQVAWRVWMKLYSWLGIQTAMSNGAKMHFYSHENLLLASKKSWLVMNMIWIACVNSLWQCRNEAIFRGDSVDIDRVVDLVQHKV
ncbi:uncharacterized protein LOC130737050 [Lotus japonicus]|uniref:uncharacterized protein LOC130737050 n=1 Tax=Lotus japonicus TaxID=34305 RepID=UPI002588FB67|nr:uncharacterized protein LOC130737050 [Lotus japonicus]